MFLDRWNDADQSTAEIDIYTPNSTDSVWWFLLTQGSIPEFELYLWSEFRHLARSTGLAFKPVWSQLNNTLKLERFMFGCNSIQFSSCTCEYYDFDPNNLYFQVFSGPRRTIFLPDRISTICQTRLLTVLRISCELTPDQLIHWGHSHADLIERFLPVLLSVLRLELS